MVTTINSQPIDKLLFLRTCTIYGNTFLTNVRDSFVNPKTILYHIKELELDGYVLSEKDSNGMEYNLDTMHTYSPSKLEKIYSSNTISVTDEETNKDAFDVMNDEYNDVVVYFKDFGIRFNPIKLKKGPCDKQDAWIVYKNECENENESESETWSTAFQKNMENIKISSFINKYKIECIEESLLNKLIYNRKNNFKYSLSEDELLEKQKIKDERSKKVLEMLNNWISQSPT